MKKSSCYQIDVVAAFLNQVFIVSFVFDLCFFVKKLLYKKMRNMVCLI